MYRKEVDLIIGFKSTSFVLCTFLFCYISFYLKNSHFVLSKCYISFCRIKTQCQCAYNAYYYIKNRNHSMK
nr:MAG TPA: hypothetical protein [Caudoviricetes sp.]